jgi:NAD+ kinase
MPKSKAEKKTIKTVAIITKRSITDNAAQKKCLRQLVKFLKKNKKRILCDNNSAPLFKKVEGHKKDYLLKNADLAITLGGDGTILKTARKLSRKKILILGVNFGNLGFLTECRPDKMLECLTRIFKGNYHIDKRSLLRATIYRSGKKADTYLALNDAVINQGAFARLIEMDLAIDSLKLVKFKADGLIVSTPTGSTAHSLSAGGPIVHPYIEGLILTPICPNSLSMRPIILPDQKMLTVTIETQRHNENAVIGLTLDGQDMTTLNYGDKIKIRRSKRFLNMVRTRHRYYRTLHNKLSWGDNKPKL